MRAATRKSLATLRKQLLPISTTFAQSDFLAECRIGSSGPYLVASSARRASSTATRASASFGGVAVGSADGSSGPDAGIGVSRAGMSRVAIVLDYLASRLTQGII